MSDPRSPNLVPPTCQSRYKVHDLFPCPNPPRYRYLGRYSTNPAPTYLCEDCAYQIASDLADDFRNYRIVFHDVTQPIPNPVRTYYESLSAEFAGMPRDLLEMLHVEYEPSPKFPTFRSYIQSQIEAFDTTGDLALADA